MQKLEFVKTLCENGKLKKELISRAEFSGLIFYTLPEKNAGPKLLSRSQRLW